jgi:iron(III) transport system permease protein
VYTQIALGGEPGVPPLGALPGILGTAWLLVAGLLLATELARHGHAAGHARPLIVPLGRWRLVASAGLWWAVLLLAGVPLGNLIYKAGWVAQHTVGGWQHGWSPARFLEIVTTSPGRFRREFGWTLLLAALATAIVLAISAALNGWAQGRTGRQSFVWVLTATCLALPGPVIGLSLIGLFQSTSAPPVAYLYDRTLLAPLLAQSIRALPLAAIVIWYALSSVPRELIDAAAVDGLSPARTLWRVVLPLRWPAVAAAGCLAFAVAAGDLAATILVAPPGIMTVPMQIFSLIHSGVDDQVAGVCLTLILGYSLLAIAAFGLLGRWRRSA